MAEGAKLLVAERQCCEPHRPSYAKYIQYKTPKLFSSEQEDKHHPGICAKQNSVLLCGVAVVRVLLLSL